MSWSSRFGGWASGRFSPFTRPNENQQVTEDDYSYITSEDLESHHHSQHDHDRRHSPRLPDRASRDTDIVIVRHRKTSYPIHFPSYSIDDGELTIGDVRKEAAKRLDTPDYRRIRMFYRGRNLKDDKRTCREEAFRSDSDIEILCVIGEKAVSQDEPETLSGSEIGRSAEADGHGDAKRRERNRKRKDRRRRTERPEDANGTASPAPPTSTKPIVEHLPVPTGTHPLHKAQSASSPRSQSPGGTSSQAQSRSPAPPQTPLGKLNAIADKFHDELLPQCIDFTDNPPPEKAKRDYDHKKLTETVLAQVLLKLDGVEAEGDEEIRTRRKALVKEAQGWLGKLDAVMK